VGGGQEAVPGIKLAKSMGLRVLVSDVEHVAPGVFCADESLICSTYDVEKTLDQVLKYVDDNESINGVLSLGSDVPLTVATVASNLKLPGISIESATLASNKLLMKERFAAEKVSIPWFQKLKSSTELKNIVSQTSKEFVIKPVDSRGARGVLLVDKYSDHDWAFEESLSYSPTNQVMIEEFLDGPQVSTESLMVDGKCFTVGFADRNYEFMRKYAPYIIENGGDLPSHLPKNVQNEIHNLIESAAQALGIRNGVVKGDVVYHNGRPYIIEIAARLSGGYFCTHQIPLNTGINFVEKAIRQTLGETISPSELRPIRNRGVAQRYFFAPTGRVEKIEIPAWITHDPDIAFFELNISEGEIVPQVSNHTARCGNVITTGIDRNSAIAKAESVIAAIDIKTRSL